jgi:diguanylate cyclase (GGDEF)-like protein
MLSQIPLRDSDDQSRVADLIEARRRNDALTGLPGKARFTERVSELIHQRSGDPVPFAVAMIDFNDFRLLNDVYGSDAGDAILTQAGRRLRGTSQGAVFSARAGGDVFAILMPECFNDEAARAATTMFCDLIAAPFDVDGRTVRISVNAGVALYRDAAQSADDVMREAGAALHAAKRRGENTVIVHDRQLEAETRRTVQLEQALRTAISAATVDVAYQPIVSLSHGRIIGFEALARWTDPELGPVSPDVFIEIAERRGLIGTLSKMLFSKATSAARHWPDDLFLAFNLSPSQLADPATFDAMTDELARQGINPSRLEAEITETAVLAHPAAATRNIGRLRAAGVGISLDDFGTGQSSLSRLRELPFTKLKIDRSFVRPINEDRGAQTIVRAILAMCEGLGIGSVAEGIETVDQAARLVSMQCNAGQGWLFGKAKSARETEQLLRANGQLRASLAA